MKCVLAVDKRLGFKTCIQRRCVADVLFMRILSLCKLMFLFQAIVVLAGAWPLTPHPTLLPGTGLTWRQCLEPGCATQFFFQFTHNRVEPYSVTNWLYVQVAKARQRPSTNFLWDNTHSIIWSWLWRRSWPGSWKI